MRFELSLILGFVLWMASALSAVAAQLSVPLNVDYLVLDAALRQRFYTGAGGRAEFWRGSNGCGHFYATDPHFGRASKEVKLRTPGDLDASLALAGNCLSATSWTGTVEATTAPRIDGLVLKFPVTSVNFYGADGSMVESPGFDLVKRIILTALGDFSYDLSPDLQRLRQLASNAPPAAAAQLKPVLDSLRLGPDVAAQDDGVSLRLRLDVPDELMAPGAPLTAAERTAWHAAVANVDRFLNGFAGRLQAIVPDEELRRQLAGVLEDSRARVAATANTPPPGGDPLPIFFPDWQRLRAVAKGAARRGALSEAMLPTLVAISGGDAVFAIDQQAPAIGGRIALAGLDALALDNFVHAPSAP